MLKKMAPVKVVTPIEWPRASPVALASFDPRTKTCSMNCGPHALDPRTKEERLFLCDECFVNEVTTMETCEALGKIREARALLRDESKTANSRELAMVLTKLDEAEMWRQCDMQKKEPPKNHAAQNPAEHTA
jgi:hypothetical protein